MADQTLMIALAAGLAALAFALAALVRGWQSWLAFKRDELAAGRASTGGPALSPLPAARIELAHLRERVRRLEAIADGAE